MTNANTDQPLEGATRQPTIGLGSQAPAYLRFLSLFVSLVGPAFVMMMPWSELNALFVGLIAFLIFGVACQWDWASLGLTAHPAQGWPYWFKVSLILGGIVVVFSTLVFSVFHVAGWPFPLPWFNPQSADSWNWLYVGCITAPVLEEIVFRFTLCVPLCTVFGFTGTIVLSGLVFAAIHFIWGVASPDNFVAGYILAWSYLKSGTLLVPIVLHSLGNLCVFIFGIGMYFATT